MRWHWSSLPTNLVVGTFLLTVAAFAATKVHVIAFGKSLSVQAESGTGEKLLAIKIRPLIVDGRVKEYVLGLPHEVTDRLFVVRRALRVNDGLPEDSAPRWQWQLGGWMLVDRLTGRISTISLPEFDARLSSASWYRDYVAYCGLADDGKKLDAMVAQLGRRKPLLRKPLTENASDSACPAPAWQRNPVRVSFQPDGGEKQTFAIRGHVVDVVTDSDEEE
jgi:hypothetical protein